MECYLSNDRLVMYDEGISSSVPFGKCKWCDIWTALNILDWRDGIKLLWRKVA